MGEILSAAFRLDQRHWRTLVAIAAVVVVPSTLLQYLVGNLVRSQSQVTSNGVVVSTPSWAVGISGLVAALAGLLMYLVLTGALRAVADSPDQLQRLDGRTQPAQPLRRCPELSNPLATRCAW